MTTNRLIACSLVLTMLVVTGAGAGLAAANTTYDQAAAASRAWAEQLRSYSLKGKMTMETNVRGQTGGMQMEAELTGAAVMPDRLVSSQVGSMFNMSLGVGPEHSWFNLGQMQTCYLADPVPLNRRHFAGNDFELDPERIFNFYGGLDQFMLPVDLEVEAETGAETYVLGEKEIPCQVFRTAGNEAEGEGPKEYWYDPQSHLVVKAGFTLFGNRGGMMMEQKLTFAVIEYSLNEPVDESLFAFTPAPGVRIVDHLDRLTNPDAMTGQTAPEITFKTLDGSQLKLSELKGKVVFLDFWATWCGPCKIEMPHIQTLHEELGPAGEVVFLAASSEDKPTIEGFISKYGYTFKVVQVEAEDAQGLYKASNIPAGFVIDGQGVIRAHMVGAQSETQLRKALAKAGIGG